jgi:leader peptidase (prepilin peptidase)/N-methyltransferase
LFSVFVAIPFFLVMAIAVYTDIRRRLIHDWLTMPGIAYFLLVHAIAHPDRWIGYALGVIVSGGLALLMAVASRGQLGGGDVKLFALVGAAVGWQAGLYVMLFTYLLAGLFAIPVWIASRLKRGKGSGIELPMAPFIAGGASLLFLLIFMAR